MSMKIKLPSLTSRQQKIVLVGGVGAFAFIAVVVWLVLWMNADTTRQTRIAQTPSVTLSLVEPKQAEVPPSWQQEEKPPAEAQATETPPAMPAPVTPEATPAKEETPKKEAETPPAPPAAASEKAEDHIVVTKPEEAAPPAAALPPGKPELPPAVAAVQAGPKYARPFNQQDVRPRIALIIADMGLAAAATQSATQDLPGEVTLAFSSLAPNIESDMTKARAAGHEMLLTVPMEPVNYPQNDSGPNSLLVALPDPENVARLRLALSRSQGYVGIMPFMGEKFVLAEEKLAPVFDELKKDDLLIVDSTQAERSRIPALARLAKLTFARADVLIDAAARDALDAQFANLETMAREHGQVVAVIKPYPVTFEKLATWIQTLEGKGLVLAPASAVTSAVSPPAATPAEQPAEPPVQ